MLESSSTVLTKKSHPTMIRLGAIGDVLLSTGTLEYWRRHFGCSFTVVVKKGLGEIFKNHPAVAEVRELDFKALGFSGTWRTFKHLSASHKGECLVDLHGNLRTRLLCALWCGPVKRYPKFSLERRAFLHAKGLASTHRLWQGLASSNVPQRYALALKEGLVAPELLKPIIFLDKAEEQEGQALLAQALRLKLNREHMEAVPPFVVALHPYASHAPKAWPQEHWRKLAALLDTARIPWVCIGRARQALFGGNNDLTNRTTLRQTAAILKACSLLVTPDSGPMHLARAVNTPLLALFGPTVRQWGFYPEASEGVVLELDLPCRPCSLHGKKKCFRPEGESCLALLRPETVFEHILERARVIFP